MNTNIAQANATVLANLSTVFCIVNGITPTEELCQALALAVMANIKKWYDNNGRPDFNPQTEEICEDAIAEAFARVQQIADLALLSAKMGATDAQ
jgi:hypothetical protein